MFENLASLEALLGDEAKSLLEHRCRVSADLLQLPGSDWVDRVFLNSDRGIRVLVNLQRLFSHGELANSGYLSILPVDQGIEHSAGASFGEHPDYFDPINLFHLAMEGGCSAIASTYATLGILARKFAHKIPLILKINHNELLSYPNQHDQILFASVQQAAEMGCVAIGATIYFGSPTSHHQIMEISKAFELAHQKGLATILWCYLRNGSFKSSTQDYHDAADLTGQANHIGTIVGADIVKQKLPTNNGGFTALKFGKSSAAMYTTLCSDHPIDLCRYQVLNGAAGRIGLINSGGASVGKNDLAEAVRTAVINKRAGGMGLICGRKAFQKPLNEGVQILRFIQSVFISPHVTVA